MEKLHPGQFEGTHENLAQVLGLYGIFEFAFTFINEGIENSSFRIESEGKKYVLRVYRHGKKSESTILLELRFKNLLRENGIPVPIVYPTKENKELATLLSDGKEWNGILMEFVEGQSITTHPSTELLAHLARLQAKMHLLGMEFAGSVLKHKESWPNLRDGLAHKIKNPSAHGKDVEAFIERVKEYRYPLSPDLPRGYNHLDLDFDGNVLTEGDCVVGIVDFDDLQYSPVVADLGFTLWNILDDEGEDAMQSYLKEYEKIRPLNVLEHEMLPHVIFFRNYTIGIVRLVLWDQDTPEADIKDILKLEKEIPKLSFDAWGRG